MGLFSWLFGGAAPQRRSRQPLVIEGGDLYLVDVVGESHYQAALEAIVGWRSEDGCEHECQAELIPEPQNPYDRNAVRVEINGRLVGYLAREDAAHYHLDLRRQRSGGGRVFCHALIVGGWDRGNGDIGHFGVKLDLI